MTPVVLVSASALMIVGVGNKHQNMSDRVRALAAEARAPQTSAERRAVIARQIELLRKRIHCVAMAHRMLYLSILLFLAMALVLLFGPGTVAAGVALFIGGVLLILAAAIFEIVELSLARRTLDTELLDLKR